MTLGKHKDIILVHSAKTRNRPKIFKATQRRTDMARASYFVQLRPLAAQRCLAFASLFKLFQSKFDVAIMMVKIDLCRCK